MQAEQLTLDERQRPVASWRHLSLFFVIQLIVLAAGIWMVHRQAVDDAESIPRANAFRYLVLIAIEWGLVYYVAVGMRWSGTTIGELVGGRWSTAGEIIKDVLLGLAFWLLWMVAAGAAFSRLGNANGPPKSVQAIMPHTVIELALWLVVSASAGFCEEVVYRGYLQRQLGALTGNVALAVVGQGILFGVMHSYQGLAYVAAISILGLLNGWLAVWRKSLRPGIVLHVWSDAISGVVMFLRR
jgi:CAAX protease family protein